MIYGDRELDAIFGPRPYISVTFEETTMSDPVNSPEHYNQHPSGVECITIVEHMTFCRGNAIKYIWRAGDKGDPAQDLRKAIWYCEREIERITKPFPPAKATARKRR